MRVFCGLFIPYLANRMLPAESSFDYLETERLKLKILTAQTYAQLVGACTPHEWMTFFGLPTLESAEKEMARLQGGISSYNRTVLMFIIIHREDRIPIGVCGYHNWYQPHRRAEIGYMMHNITYREKGL